MGRRVLTSSARAKITVFIRPSQPPLIYPPPQTPKFSISCPLPHSARRGLVFSIFFIFLFFDKVSLYIRSSEILIFRVPLPLTFSRLGSTQLGLQRPLTGERLGALEMKLFIRERGGTICRFTALLAKF